MNYIKTMVSDHPNIFGYLSALSAGASYGMAQTVGKVITNDYAHPIVGTGFALVSGFLFVSIIFHKQIYIDVMTAPLKGFIWLGLSGIGSASGVTLLYFALDNAPLVVVSPIIAISPLITILITHITLRKLEKVTARTIAGAFLVVSGVLTITISSSL
ncbi:MAG: DMT family transporter [Dehalococcoidia bacterium]|nr:DMT family transporter [Dehalococcoidia bacterium]